MIIKERHAYTIVKPRNIGKKKLLDFYMGDDVKDKYKLIEKDIENI
jgi:hypothetical protein